MRKFSYVMGILMFSLLIFLNGNSTVYGQDGMITVKLSVGESHEFINTIP